MKKLKAQFTAEIEAQVPSGVSISFREDSSVNPSQFLVIKGTSLLSSVNSESLIQIFLDALQEALDE